MILQETIDKVFDIDIYDIVSRYVELKRSGSNWKGLSPFTTERTPSFMVSQAKGIYKCFSSGKGGNGINFIMEKESFNYPEAIKHLCSMHGIEFKETERTDEEVAYLKRKEGLYIITNVASDWYKENLKASFETYKYLKEERHLTDDIIQKFDIGYAPETFSGMTNHIINNGHSWTMAVEASVLGHQVEKNKLYDRFRGRVMFPIKSITGNIIGFGGRILVPNDKAPKYINSSDSIIYNKSEVLYGIYESKQEIISSNKAYLTEGYLDVVMWHQKGIENIVASSGTALTSEQAKLIKRFTKNVTVMFDNDNAGIRATLRGIDILLEQGMKVKVLEFPTGQDADDFAKSRTKEQIEQYIYAHEKDFVTYKLNFLLKESGEDFGLKSNAITDVVNSISKIPDLIAQEIYLRECSRMANMDIGILRMSLKGLSDESVDFTEVNTSDFNENLFKNKSFLREQCERKILQYILAYGNRELSFKEIELIQIGFEDKIEFDDEVVTNKRTVLGKVMFELDNDEIEFSNPLFNIIYDKCKIIDLSDFYLLKDYLDDNTYLMAETMRDEELAMHQSSFLNVNIIGNEIVQLELDTALAKSVNESLMFYKTIFIELMIEQLSREETPNIEMIHQLVMLLVKIKKELNLI